MFDFNIARLFANAAAAKIKNPLRQIPKQVLRFNKYLPHQGKREVCRRASQIQRGTLQTN